MFTVPRNSPSPRTVESQSLPNRSLLGLLAIGSLIWAGCSDSTPSSSDKTLDTQSLSDVEISDAGAPTPDTASTPDSEVDAAAVELPLDCPGGAGCTCVTKDDCDTGICLDTPAGHVCGRHCVSDCPSGTVCATMPGVDVTMVCVPRWGFICEPCTNSDSCAKAVGPHGSACISYGLEHGAFCGPTCQQNSDCPPDYDCTDALTIEGTSKKACTRKKNAGECPCSPRAITLQAFSSCQVTNELGTCPGTRQCKQEGLSDCQTPAAAKEICDGIDNDCNGETDDKLCNDDNECTDDACVPETSGCVHTPNTEACDDDNACTKDDTCDEKKCKGINKNCDDDNPCTDDACDPAEGCTWTPTKKACDDDNKCTNNDLCNGSGACLGLPIDVSSICDDNEICTLDHCDPKLGCLHDPQAGICDDGNPCTNGDACTLGKCMPGANVCDCVTDADCTPKEDGNLCNGTLYCDKTAAPFVCKVDPKTPVTCTNIKDPCKLNICLPKTGKCAPKSVSDGKPCNADNSICTPKDTCQGGSCVAGLPIGCDDGNPCTDDACDPVKGCQIFDNIKPCDDGNKCTLADTCASGQCIPGKKLQCDDKSPCTFDWCDKNKGKCVYDGKPQEGDPCDADGSVCTVADKCVQGVCVAGTKKPCDDKEPCTTDLCEKTSGCQHINNSEPCDADGDPCTPNDKCQNGGCAKGPPKDCDDKNTCTNDGCNTKTGKCLHVALDKKACDADGSLCTDKDSCIGAKCVAGPKLSCDDGNQCTQDSCAPLKGCLHDTTDGSPCSLQSACVKKELCVAGSCKGIAIKCDDGNPCTKDACDPKTGCTHVALTDTTSCGGGKHCVSGKCVVPGCGDGWVAKGESCDDGNTAVCDGCESCQPMGQLKLDAGSWAGISASALNSDGIVSALALEHDLTLEAWIKTSKLGVEQTIVSKGLKSAGGAIGWNLSLGAKGELLFRHQGPSGGEIAVAMKDGKPLTVKAGVWAHVAAVLSAETLRLYLDGLPSAPMKLLKPRRDVGEAGVSIGRRFWDSNIASFQGWIDEVHLAAVPMHGNAFKPSRRIKTHPRTVAMWRMDRSMGGVIADDGPQDYPLKLHGALITKDDCYGANPKGAVCGDGVVSAAFEACDDKNNTSCDGCESCQIQQHWSKKAADFISVAPFNQWAADTFCPTCDLTVEAWIRPDKTTGSSFEILGSSCAMISLMIAPQPGVGSRFGAYRFPMQPAFSKTAVKPGKWTHIAATMGLYAGAELRLYINGKLESSVDLKMAANLQGYDIAKEMLFIGAGTGGSGGGCLSKGEIPKPFNGFIGKIDEVRVSKGARYTDDFTPKRHQSPDAQTRGLWRFDDAKGTLRDDSGRDTQAKLSGGTFVADACYGDLSGTAVCGDGQAAKWEMCDNGSANGPLPQTCSKVCTPNKPWKTPDCTSLSWSEGKHPLGKNTMTYAKTWTLEGWAKLSKLPISGWGALLSVDEAPGCKSMPVGQRWVVGVGPQGLEASMWGGLNQKASPPAKPWKVNAWQHFALQYHGAHQGSLYIDGALARTFTGVSSAWSTSCPLHLGGSLGGGDHKLGAKLASLRLSDRVRYGQPFIPPTTLQSDAHTTWLFDFNDSTGAKQAQDLDGIYLIDLNGGLPTKTGPTCKS